MVCILQRALWLQNASRLEGRTLHGGSRNRSVKRAAGEVVSPAEIHIPSMKGEKRLRLRGSLHVSEGGRRLRDGAAEVLINEGINDHTAAD